MINTCWVEFQLYLSGSSLDSFNLCKLEKCKLEVNDIIKHFLSKVLTSLLYIVYTINKVL